MKSAKGFRVGAALWGFDNSDIVTKGEFYRIVVEYAGETFKSQFHDDPFVALDECEYSPLGRKAFKARHGFFPRILKHSIDIEA